MWELSVAAEHCTAPSQVQLACPTSLPAPMHLDQLETSHRGKGECTASPQRSSAAAAGQRAAAAWRQPGSSAIEVQQKGNLARLLIVNASATSLC